MIIGRELRIALLISFLAHLLGMCLISIVFLPHGFILRGWSSVSFVGSILKGSVSVQAKAQAEGGDLVEFPPEAKINHFEQELVALPTERKMLNPDNFIDVDSEPQNIHFAFSRDYTGKKEREIIFQPPFVKYPEVAIQDEVKGDYAVFNVYISSNGLVEQVVNMQASSNPEIDVALIRYIEKWRFVPAPESQGQWQTIKIALDSK
ncbi:MAG: TonB family protein [Candidatus Omnitrophota bacterium]|nr:MAG: TonB family protein [Candidatus Omnitrophota bacterium]